MPDQEHIKSLTKKLLQITDGEQKEFLRKRLKEHPRGAETDWIKEQLEEIARVNRGAYEFIDNAIYSLFDEIVTLSPARIAVEFVGLYQLIKEQLEKNIAEYLKRMTNTP